MAKHDPDLSRIFHALGDPTRRALLAQIGGGEVPVSVLAGPTGFSLPTVLRHLEVLESAGLVTTQKQGRTRMCRSRPETLSVAVDWLSQQREQWESQLDRLENYVMTLMKDGSDAP